MKSKRGISPLLATVILVGVAVSLAAMVSNYLIEQAKEFDPESIAEESVYCESVTLGYTADDTLVVTLDADGGLIGPITLVNRGSFSIHQLIITAPGYPSRTSNILVADDGGGYIPSVIAPGENNRYNIKIQFDPNSDNKEIKIVPVIKDTEKKQLVKCPKRQVVINYKMLCGDIFGNEVGFDTANPCGVEV